MLTQRTEGRRRSLLAFADAIAVAFNDSAVGMMEQAV